MIGRAANKTYTLDPVLTWLIRPISNLSFLSKLLETVVQKRLQSFLCQTSAVSKNQSAYSTDISLLKIYNDLLLAAGGGEVSALCILDLSAAFDTFDHGLILKWLEYRFDVTGEVL